MRGLAIINPNFLKGIERSTFLIGTITLVVSIFLLGNAGFNFFRFNETETKLAATKQQIHTLADTISKSKRLKFSASSVKELSTVQGSLDRLAGTYDCLLTEVNSNNDEGVYMSRYVKGASDAGWKQFVVQCQMIGSLNNIMSLLKDLSMISVPIELQSVEITPLEKHRNGHPQVLAKVILQVMRQEVTR